MSRRFLEPAIVRDVAVRAIENNGSQVSRCHFKWDVAGRCTRPVAIDLEARSDRKLMVAYESGAKPRPVEDPWSSKLIHWVELMAPCRQCAACLRARSRLWAGRAAIEIERSSRTWFCTFTLDEEWQHHFLSKARHKCAEQSIDFDGLDLIERFRLHDREIQREFTLMFKRWRKNYGVRFRYILVAEQHKSGLPHYHALLHEQGHGMTWRMLKAGGGWWGRGPTGPRPYGLTEFKLVQTGYDTADSLNGTVVPWYVCKYLAKSAVSRVRSSVRYGEEQPLSVDKRPKVVANKKLNEHLISSVACERETPADGATIKADPQTRRGG